MYLPFEGSVCKFTCFHVIGEPSPPPLTLLALGITSARSTRLYTDYSYEDSGVLLGRRREALSSTTRNQSSSQLQKGANQNRGPPTLNRDEDPC